MQLFLQNETRIITLPLTRTTVSNSISVSMILLCLGTSYQTSFRRISLCLQRLIKYACTSRISWCAFYFPKLGPLIFIILPMSLTTSTGFIITNTHWFTPMVGPQIGIITGKSANGEVKRYIGSVMWGWSSWADAIFIAEHGAHFYGNPTSDPTRDIPFN